jgi:serine protease
MGMTQRSWRWLFGWSAALLSACHVPMLSPATVAGPVQALARLKARPTPHRSVAIGFKSLPSDAAIQTLLAGLPLTVKRVLSNAQVVVVKLKTPGDKATLAKLTKLPGVEYAEWEGVGSVLADVNAAAKAPKTAIGPETGDPMAKEQWALDRIQAPAAWTLSKGSQDTIIAIVDTGIDLQHPDLRAKLVGGINITDPQQAPKDDFGHGTHVAGIAAASVGNGVGIAGVAPAARLMPIKVNLPESGGLEESDVADGILWAANHGADVINLSLGFTDGETEFRTLGRAVSYALQKKCIVVAAMGNSFQFNGANHPQFPAAWSRSSSLSGIIAVGATTQEDRRWEHADTGAWQTLAAPGYAILSTTPTYKVAMTGMKDAQMGHDVKLNYGRMSGTSMATPYVAGVAALLLSRMKHHEPALVKAKLAQSADRVGQSDLGVGRVNALATLKLL